MKKIVAGSLLGAFALTLISFVAPQYVAHATGGMDCNQVSDVNPLECSALVEIYDNNTSADWSSYAGWFETLVLGSQDDTVCDWQGVTCTNSAITDLSLTNLALDVIPDSIANITSLSSLQISHTNITQAPGTLGNLSLLTSLDLSNNRLTTMPDIQGLGNLEVALFNNNQLTSIIGLGNLTFLHTLTFDNNYLLTIEEGAFDSIPSISTFFIDNNYLTSGMLAETTVIFLDTYAPNRQTTQIFENDNILSNVQVGYEQNYRLVTIAVDYNLGSGGSVLSNSIIFTFNTHALTPDPANDPNWRFDSASGYYYYALPTSSFEPSSGTIIFTGTLGGKTNTGYVYPFYFLLSQRRQEYQYDINTGNNVAEGTYQRDASASQFQYCDLMTATEGKQCRSLMQLATENSGSTLTSLPGWSALLEPTPIITTICDRQGVSCSNKGRANIIDLAGTNISTVSSGFFNGLSELSELYLNNNQITSLPDELEEIANLELLDLSHNQLSSLPLTIDLLQGLTSLFVNNNQITSLPQQLYTLGSYNALNILDISNNNISSISSDIYQMGSLISFNVSNNELTTIPAEIGTLANLSSLFFSGNLITSLDPGLFAQIGNNLTAIDVSYNYLARSRLDTSETDILDMLQSDWESTQYTIDLDAPELSDIHIETSNANDPSIAILGDEISLSFYANEELEISNLIVTIAGQSASVSQEDCGPGVFCYAASILTDEVTDQGNLEFTIDYEDLFGNAGLQETATSDFSSVFIDSIGPIISSAHLESDHATNIALATVGNNVMLSFEADEPISTEVYINGNHIEPSSFACENSCYLATRTVSDPGETNDFVTIEITSYDDYGNTGEIITQTTDGSNVLIDTIAPTLSNIHIESTHIPSNQAGLGDTLIVSFASDEEIDLPNLEVGQGIYINGLQANLSQVACDDYCYEATLLIDENRTGNTPEISIIVRDETGNISEEATSTTDGSNVLIDNSNPTHDLVIITSSNINDPSLARQGNTITVRFETDEQIDTTSITGNIADIPVTSAATGISCNMSFCYDVHVVVQSNTPEGTGTFSIYYTDTIGNVPNAGIITSTYDGSYVIIDRTITPLSYVSFSSSNHTGFAHIGDTVTVTILSSEILIEAYPILGGFTGDAFSLIGQGSCGGNSDEYCYQISMQIDGNFSEGNQSLRIDYADLAGNEGQHNGTTDGSSLTIDNTQATITNVHIESNNIYSTGWAKSGDVVTISFKSNEPIQTGLSNASIYGANTADLTTPLVPFACSGGYCYRFSAIVDNTTNGAVTFQLDFADMASNMYTTGSTTDGSSVITDNTAPSPISIDMYSDNISSGDIAISGSIVTLFLQTDEPLRAGSISMLIAGQTGTIHILSGAMADGCSPYYCYRGEIVARRDSTQGPASLFAQYSDRAGNTTTISSLTTGDHPVFIDTILPELANIHLQSNNTFSDQTARSGNVITISFSSNEELYLSNTYADIYSDNISNLSRLSCATYCYSGTIVVPYYWQDGPAELYLAYSDNYGNGGETSSTSDASEVIIDNTPPTILAASIASSNSDPSIALEGDDVVVGFETDEVIDITGTIITIGGRPATVEEAACGGGICYVASVTIDSNFPDGNLNISLSYTDLIGNQGTTHTETTDSSSVEVVREVEAPTLTFVHIASDNPHHSSFARSGDHIILTFSGSEELDINNIDVDINGQSAIIDEISCSGHCYTATIQVTSALSNPITFTIDYTNLSGTPGTQETSVTDGSSVTLDVTPPSVLSASIRSSNSQTGLAASGNTIMVSFRTNEILLTGAISMNIANKSATVQRMANCAGFCYSGSIIVDSSTTSGAVTFSVQYADFIGNSGSTLTNTTDSTAINIDMTLPTLSNILLFSNNAYSTGAKSGDRITVLFSASEALMTGSLSGIIAGKAANLQRMSCGGFCYSGSIIVDNTTTNGTGSINILYADIAGNTGTTRTSATSGYVIIDTTKPTLNTIHIATNNVDTTLGENGNTITLSFRSSEALATGALSVLIGGQAASVSPTACSEYCYTATLLMDDNMGAGTVSFAISYQDIIGNIGDSVTSTSDSSSVTISTCASVSDISETECKALVSIATLLSGTNVVMMSGWSQAIGTTSITNVCDWEGISCSGEHIDGLDLSDNNLSTLPNAISSLPYLTALDISNNNFSTIPRVILNISDLSILSLAHNELITIPGATLSSLSNLSVLDVSYNHLARAVIEESEIDFMDTLQPNWEATQSIESDSLINGIVLSPTSGVQMTGSTMTLGIRYTQGTGGASFTGNIILSIGTGMTAAAGNNGWQSLGNGLYKYTLLPSYAQQNNATVSFIGAFVSDAGTGIEYEFSFTLWSGYDNDDTNNIVSSTYSWIDTVSAPRATQTETRESISPTFGINTIPRLDDRKTDEKKDPTETTTNNDETRGNTEGSTTVDRTPPPAPASVYKWAYNNGVTTMPISNARLYVPIQRYEAATMIVNYVKNVEKKEITPRSECDVSRYSDITNTTNPAVRKVVQDVCNLGIMGVGATPDKLIPRFRPYDTLSVNEIQIILKRYDANNNLRIRRNLRIDVMDLLMKTLK